MSTLDELNRFTQFVHDRLSNESGQRSRLSELFEQWMIENPDDPGHEENVAAINASIADFTSGERGTLAGEHSQELRKKLGTTGK